MQMIAFAFLLALLSPPPEAKPPVDVFYHGARETFSSDYLHTLAEAIEDLALGSGFAAQASSPGSAAGLVVVVHYSPPLELTLHTLTPRVFYADQISLYNDEHLNDGWPLLLAFSPGTSWSLAKYNGGLVLDLLCSDELEPLATHAVTSNCHVAPSRRGAEGRLTPRCSGQYPGLRPGIAAELIRR